MATENKKKRPAEGTKKPAKKTKVGMYDDYVRSLQDTLWVVDSKISSHNQIAIGKRIENAAREILYAAIYPVEHDPKSFTVLFHKTVKGRILLITFPDEDGGAKYNEQEAIKFAETLGKDLIRVYTEDRKCQATLVSATHHRMAKAKHIPFFDYKKEAAARKYPYFMEVVLDLDFDRPVGQIIQRGSTEEMNEALSKCLTAMARFLAKQDKNTAK
jgi:hypothetical protein